MQAKLLPVSNDEPKLERVTGFEPVSERWQRSVLATRRYPRNGASGENRTLVSWVEAKHTGHCTTPASIAGVRVERTYAAYETAE